MKVFNILVVDDEEMTLSQLVKLLRESLPHAEIVQGQSIGEGKRLIDEAIRDAKIYDLAILDFKLPKVTGGIDDVDETLCRSLSDQMPSTVVSHVTGYAKDPRIIAHIDREHTGRTLGFFLDKRQPNFARELVKSAKQALYGAWIERELGDLFAREATPRPDGPGARSAAPRLTGSASSRIVELSLEIAEIWPELSRATQVYVRRHFAVEPDPAGRVSVVKR